MNNTNPIINMADGAERWAAEVFEAVRINQPDEPGLPPIDPMPTLNALGSWNHDDAAERAIGATDDHDARDAIDAAVNACESFRQSAMAASTPADIAAAFSALGRSIKALRRYTACVKLDEPTGTADDPPTKPDAMPEVKRIAMLYQQAQADDLALSTDHKVWEYLKEQHEPGEVPAFEAFRKLAGKARKAGLLEAKRAARTPKRATGKSVISHDQL